MIISGSSTICSQCCHRLCGMVCPQKPQRYDVNDVAVAVAAACEPVLGVLVLEPPQDNAAATAARRAARPAQPRGGGGGLRRLSDRDGDDSMA